MHQGRNSFTKGVGLEGLRLEFIAEKGGGLQCKRNRHGVGPLHCFIGNASQE